MSTTVENETKVAPVIQDENFGDPVAPNLPAPPSYKLDKCPEDVEEEEVDSEQGYANLIIGTNLALFVLVWTECREEMKRREPGWDRTMDLIGLWCPAVLAAAGCVVTAVVAASLLIGLCFANWLVIRLIAASAAIVRCLFRFVKTAVSKGS